MRLNKKQAIELSIELWTWMAEKDGRRKGDWPEWKRNGGQYPGVACNCFLCEYDEYREKQAHVTHRVCHFCPYYKVFGDCESPDSPYNKWWISVYIAVYAKQFLEQLRQLQDEEKPIKSDKQKESQAT